MIELRSPLTPKQHAFWLALAHLLKDCPTPPPSIREVAACLGMGYQTTRTHFENLAAKGYIYRARVPKLSRAYRLKLWPPEDEYDDCQVLRTLREWGKEEEPAP